MIQIDNFMGQMGKKNALPKDPVLRKNIFALRKEKMISQADIADKLGMEPTNYGKIERGEVALSAEGLIKLAELFEVSLDELVGRKIKIEKGHDMPTSVKEEKGKKTKIILQIEVDEEVLDIDFRNTIYQNRKKMS
jgi:transcriptional regulator with XRE-family HTH domain